MPAGPGPTSVSQPVVTDRIPAVRHEVRALPPLSVRLRHLLALDPGAEGGRGELISLIESWGLKHDLQVEAVSDADNTYRHLLLTFVRAALEPALANGAAAFPWDEYWRHNLAVAWAAELLATRAPGCAGQSFAFAAGLLHDVGKWALLVCFPRSYERVLERMRQRGECICVAEHELFGCDHAWAGRELATRWGLPSAVVECAWLHHQSPIQLPPQVEHPGLVRLVHVADQLARRAGIGFSGFGHTETITELGLVAGLSESVLNEVKVQLAGRVEQAARRAECGLDLADALRAGEGGAEGQRLRLAASCATALARSGALERPGQALEQTCGAVAGLVCDVLPARAAVVAVATEAGAYLHVGGRSTRPAQLPERVVSLRSGRLADVWAEVPGVGMRHGWPDAPAAAQSLWRVAGLPDAAYELKWFGLRHEGVVVGLVLADLTPEVSSGWQAAPEFAQALADVLGLTVGGVRARLQTERAREELLGQDRRARGQEDERLRRRSLAQITEVAGGAAHEMNNPLAVISGRAQMLLSGCEDEGQARGLRIIVEQAQRASEIAQDLMGFAKPDPPQPVRQSLKDLLSAVCQHWQARAARASVRIMLETVPVDATVFADGAQLHAVLDALIANALEAARGENARVQINSTFHPADDTVRIVVEDNGVGMEREVLEHALDPFYSNRPAGRGRGLGLSRAYRLVEINGGRLRLESTPKIGTVVTLELPA